MYKQANRFQPDAAMASVDTSLIDVFTLFLYCCDQSRLLGPLLPTPDTHLIKVLRIRDWRPLGLQLDVCISPSPPRQGPGSIPEERAIGISELQDGEEPQERLPSSPATAVAATNTQAWVPAWDWALWLSVVDERVFPQLRAVDGAGGGVILSNGVTTRRQSGKKKGFRKKRRMELEVNEGVHIWSQYILSMYKTFESREKDGWGYGHGSLVKGVIIWDKGEWQNSPVSGFVSRQTHFHLGIFCGE